MAFDDNKTRDWDRTTLNDGLFFNDEFNRVYGSLNDVDGRILNMDDALSALTQYSYALVAGIIQGEIYWDQTGGGVGNVAVAAGRYEVNTKMLTINADIVTSPVTHNYGNNAEESDYWYYTLLDSTGNVRRQMATGTSLLTDLEVNSVTDQGGGNFQITFRNSPDLSGINVGMLFRSDDLDGGNAGVFKISSVVDAGTFKIQVANNSGSTEPAATDPVGTGSLFESIPLLNTPNPAFDITRQGYYDGDRRILGVDFYEVGRLYRWVISYKSGYNRNDNRLTLNYFNGYANVDTYIIWFRDVLRQWGSDYSYANDSDSGSVITFNRSGRVMCQNMGYGGNPGHLVRGFSLNATVPERNIGIHDIADRQKNIAWSMSREQTPGDISVIWDVNRGDVLRVQANTIVPQHYDYETAHFIFEPS